MAQTQRLLLLDTATLYYRGYYGLPATLTMPSGEPNNAIRGFCDGLATLVTALQPTHVVCAWDADWRPQFRVDAWSGYKTHRVTVAGEEEAPDDLSPQIDAIAALLDAAGIARIGVAEFEADDVIATIARCSEMAVDIVTSDRDLFQCIDDTRSVRVASLSKGVRNLDFLTGDTVAERYGIRVDQYVDFATLRGDASDGLPGVPGIGVKTAATLLAQFQTLDEIYAAARDSASDMPPGVRRKLLAAEDTVAALRFVTCARIDVPIPTQSWNVPAQPTQSFDELSQTYGVPRLRASWAAVGLVPQI